MNNNKIIFIVIIGFVILGLFFLMSKKSPKKIEKNNKKEKLLTKAEIEKRIKEEEEIIGYKYEDEEKIMENIRANRSLNNLANYADKITRQYINDEKFLQAQLPEDLLTKLKSVPIDKNKMARVNLINPTTIGNTAFIIKNSAEPYKSRAQQALNYLLNKL